MKSALLSHTAPAPSLDPIHARVSPDQRCAWAGSSLLVVNSRGECDDADLLSGFYYREARFLRICRLEIDGHRPWLCEAAEISPTELDFSDTYPEITHNGGRGSGQSGDDEPRDAAGLPQRALHIDVRYSIEIAR